MTVEKKSNYGKEFITPLCEVFWSSLGSPDIKFGNPNHSVTVEVTSALGVLINDAVKSLGGKKVNAMREYEGKKLIKFKSTLMAKEGKQAFPIIGANLEPTTMIPFRPDLVRVKVVPVFIERDSSVSFYLKEVQLVERRYQGSESISFTKVGD